MKSVRKIPKGCPLLANSKIKILRISFIRVCQAKQAAGDPKKVKAAYGRTNTSNALACSVCPIKQEVNEGRFRRPVPDQVEFIYL